MFFLIDLYIKITEINIYTSLTKNDTHSFFF